METRLLLGGAILLLGCSGGGGAGTTDTETGASDSAATDSASGTGSGATTAGATSDSVGTTGGTADSDATGAGSSGGVKYDVGGATTGGACDCGSSFSFVWVANSGESTVSKIDTATLQEVGRYLTRADGDGNPSRTSVSIDGNAVAVANRAVGLTKIWARPELCAGASTSTGKNDVKAWDAEDCRAWFLDFPDMTVQRPVAWTSGTLDEETCEYEDQKIWTITGKGGSFDGVCGPEGLWVHLVDGDAGTIDQTIMVPENEAPCAANGTSSPGVYGAAVDAEGNLWAHGRENLWLMRVDRQGMTYEVFPDDGSYGITVDTKGRVWTNWSNPTAVKMFDYATKQWTVIPMPFITGNGGLAEDHQGRIWTGGKNTGPVMGWVDMDTLVAGDVVDVPEALEIKGTSVDVNGNVWAVGPLGAYRIDPDSYMYMGYEGLTDAYTYSDMTGGALNNVTCNPAG